MPIEDLLNILCIMLHMFFLTTLKMCVHFYSYSSSVGSSNEKEESDVTANHADYSESLADTLHSVISGADYRGKNELLYLLHMFVDNHYEGKFEYFKNMTDTNSWNSTEEPPRSSLCPSSEDDLETGMTDMSSCKSSLISLSEFLMSTTSSKKMEELLSGIYE